MRNNWQKKQRRNIKTGRKRYKKGWCGQGPEKKTVPEGETVLMGQTGEGAENSSWTCLWALLVTLQRAVSVGW